MKVPTVPRALQLVLEVDPIVVTGMGAICATGPDTDSLWQAVRHKRSAARWVDLPLPNGGTARRVGFPVAEIDWTDHPWARMARRLDLGAQYALHAAYQAVGQSGVFENPPAPRRFGVICGSSRGPKQKWEEAYGLMLQGRRVKPTLATTTTLASVAGALAQVLGARGPSWLTSAACASGAFAIIAAAEQIALGHADVMVAGGSDQALNAVVYAGLESASVLARSDDPPADWCRPFGEGRTGLVPGDGAGMLVLESLSSAKRRGATPLATLSGWGSGIAPEGLAGMDPLGSGLVETMQSAMALAGIAREQIDYINAHGTGTLTNDAAEAAAISQLFGQNVPLCSSSKAITGHCLGATPALEAILCIQALRHGAVPPAYPADRLEAGVNLRFAVGDEPIVLRHALSNSAAFWGFSASLLLGLP